jgi:GAF domain-containing protein
MARWRDAVLEVQAAILSGTEVEAVLHTVAEVARRLVDADVATVAVPRVEGTSLVLRAAAGYRADDLRGAVFPVDESLSGAVLRTGRALHLQDAARHDDAYQPICELGDLGPSVLLPLERGPETFGTLLVARRHGRDDFGEEDLELLRLFALHVSVAVEFCRGQEQLQRLASVQESERVSRELHDTVLQRLFAIGLRLQALSADERGAVGAKLQTVLDELDGTVREIRSTVLEAGPG